MTGISREAAQFWDENREKSNDPTFWMAHPICRQAINRRVSGDPHEWPIDWLKRVHVRTPLPRGLSFGCGLGALERALIRAGLVSAIDAFDVSEASLADARREAEKEEIRGIDYRIGDFNDPNLERGRYDIAFFHQSLHHVSELERLFERLVVALKPGGLLYVDEYVGPSRTGWTPQILRARAWRCVEPAVPSVPSGRRETLRQSRFLMACPPVLYIIHLIGHYGCRLFASKPARLDSALRQPPRSERCA